MSFLKKLKGKREEVEPAKPKQVAKPTIYFATKDGITDNGTRGGLLNYRTEQIERNAALDELTEALKTHGFSYNQSLGLIFQGENEEDAKNKLLNQKNNKISEDDLNKFEEKWIEEQWTKYEEKKGKEEKKEEGKKEGEKEKEKKKKEEIKREELELLDKYRVPKELKEKLAGKTGIEIEYGINVDYDKAIEGLDVWKRFES